MYERRSNQNYGVVVPVAQGGVLQRFSGSLSRSSQANSADRVMAVKVSLRNFSLMSASAQYESKLDPWRPRRRHSLRSHLELELELIQTHMAQKPMLRVEVSPTATPILRQFLKFFRQ